MRDENPIRTLGDYSKPSYENYRNTIELPVRNNVVPLRSYTIRLEQNGCSFHGICQSNLEGLVSNFMESQDARLSKFEANFKQQQSKMTKKIDSVLKAIKDRMTSTLVVRSYYVSDLSSCASSELTFLAGSDTRPPMLDRTDFASWQQRIRLYCQGKENEVNILQSIDEGRFQIGTFWETLTEGNEGVIHLGSEWPRIYSDLSPEEKERGLRDSNYDQLYAYLKQHEAHANDNKMMLNRFTQHIVDPLALMSNVSHQRNQATVQDDRVVFQNVQGRQNRGQENNARGAGAAGYEGAQNIVRNANPSQARQIKCYNFNGMGYIPQNCTQPKRPHNSEYFKDKMLLMQAQENGVTLDEEQLLFIAGGQDNVVDEDVDKKPVQDLTLNVDNVFQADDCDAFDSDVDEAPTAQTIGLILSNLGF
nr:retrovirus-related Pol polyprotein from transposon TNT 1-94 [Tanacetum cinerariifolium]